VVFLIEKNMDEAYKILPKDQHQYWDNFKKLRSEKVVNYVRSILLDEVELSRFIVVMRRLSTSRVSPSAVKKTYQWLQKWKWIK
jgi:hypothetical protein